jgi:GAF domain-containing protein
MRKVVAVSRAEEVGAPGEAGPGRLRERQLVTTFVELADTLVEDFDLVDLLTSLAGRVTALGFASEVGIHLADESGELRFVAGSHERPHLLELYQLQAREGPCLDSFRAGVPVVVADLASEAQRWPRFVPCAAGAGFASVEAVPMRWRGTNVGVVSLFLQGRGALEEDDRPIVRGLADVATISLLHQRELHRAHTVEQQLQQALHSRIGIEQAKGMVSEQAGTTVDVAFELLRTYARRRNAELSSVARAVVDGSMKVGDLRAEG